MTRIELSLVGLYRLPRPVEMPWSARSSGRQFPAVRLCFAVAPLVKESFQARAAVRRNYVSVLSERPVVILAEAFRRQRLAFQL